MTFKIPQRWKRSLKREIALLTTFALLLGYSMPISAMGGLDSTDSGYDSNAPVIASPQSLLRSGEFSLDEAVTITGGGLFKVVSGTNIELTSPATIRKNDLLEILYEFQVDETKMEAIIAAGPDAKYTVPIPQELEWPDDFNGSYPLYINDEDGTPTDEIFGYLHLSPGNAHVTFATDYLADEGITELVDAAINANCYLNKDLFAPDGPESKTIRFAWGCDFTVDLPENIKTPMGLTKQRVSGPINGKFSWRVTYTPGAVPAEALGGDRDSGAPYVLEDRFPANEQILDNSSIRVGGNLLTAADYTVTTETDNSKVPPVDYTVLRYPIPDGNTGPVVLTYDTIVSDAVIADRNNSSTLTNEAAVMGKDEAHLSLGGKPLLSTTQNGTVSSTNKDILSKQATGTNSEGRTIHWKVVVNTLGRTLGDPITLTDNLPEGLKLKTGSVTVKDAGNADAAHTVIPSSTPNSTADASNNFSVAIAKPGTGDYSPTYTIEYDTIIDDKYYDAGSNTPLPSFSNSVTMSADWYDYGTGTLRGTFGDGVTGAATATSPNVNVVQKSGTNYNPATHEITWQVAVNPHKVNVTGGTITENLDGRTTQKMTYVPGSFTLPVADSGRVVITEPNDGKDLTFTVGNIGTNTVTFTFRTTVDNEADWANNKTSKSYYNDISFSGTVGTDSVTATSTGNRTVTSTVLEKPKGSYDYDLNQAIWTVTVNKNAMPMTGVIITDQVPAGQTFVAGSVKVGSTVLNPEDYTISEDGRTLTVPLGDIGDTKTITYRTQVDVNAIPEFRTAKVVTVGNGVTLTRTSEGLKSVGPVNSTTDITSDALTKGGTLHSSGGSYDYISYRIAINPNGLYLEDSVLTDHMPEGLLLDQSTVALYRASNSGGTLSKIVPNSTVDLTDIFSYNPAAREFSIQLPNSSDRYILEYNADVIDVGKAPFKNKVSFEGGFVREDDQVNNSQGTAGGGGGGGGVALRKGSIALDYKTDALTGSRLSGAVFTLYLGDKDNYDITKPLDRKITDGNGYLKFSALTPGATYTVVETEAPEGYLPVEPIQVTITDLANRLTKPTEWNWVITSGLADQRKANTIAFQKQDDYGDVLPGATFEIKRTNPATPAYTAQQTSGANGNVAFVDLPVGDYEITEVSAPTNYVSSTETWTASILPSGQPTGLIRKSDNASETGPLVNASHKTTLQLVKVEAGTNKPLEDATFELFDAVKGTSLGQQTSDDEGKLSFAGLHPSKTYRLEEVTPPTGYQALEPITITIPGQDDEGWNNWVLTRNITNDRVTSDLEFTKVTDEDEVLVGAVFTITGTDPDNGAFTTTATSAADGKVRFASLPFGNYLVEETTTPADFEPTTQKWTVEVFTDGTNSGLVPQGETAPVTQVVNDYKRTTLEVLKTDSVTGDPLEGAVFELFTLVNGAKGQSLGTQTSDTDGNLAFTGLLPGRSYHLEEVSPPLGYQPGEPHTFTVGKSEDANFVYTGTIAYTAPNDKITKGIHFEKTTQWGAPLPGVEFRLWGVSQYNSGVERFATSDQYGKVLFPELIYGEYHIEELSTQPNYILSGDKWKAEILKTGEATGLSRLSDGQPVDGNKVVNLSKDASLSLRKTNEVTRRPMANVEFTLLDGDTHTAVATGKTDRDGNLTFTGLLAGKTYILRETTPPGFLPVKDVTVTVDAGDENALALQNRRVPSDSGDYWPKDPKPSDPKPDEPVTGTNTPGSPGGGKIQQPEGEESMGGSSGDRGSSKIRDTGLDWMTPLALGALGLALLGGAVLGSKKEDADDSKTA